MTSLPKRRKRRRRRRKIRKNIRRGTGALQSVAGRALTPFIPVTSRGSRREKGLDTHTCAQTHITNMHRSSMQGRVFFAAFFMHAFIHHCLKSMYVHSTNVGYSVPPGKSLLRWPVVSPGLMTCVPPLSSRSALTINQIKLTGPTSPCTGGTWPGNYPSVVSLTLYCEAS